MKNFITKNYSGIKELKMTKIIHILEDNRVSIENAEIAISIIFNKL